MGAFNHIVTSDDKENENGDYIMGQCFGTHAYRIVSSRFYPN